MKTLLRLIIFIVLLLMVNGLKAQNLTVASGQQISTITLPGPDCNYTWTNDHPEIGLPVAGTGNIPTFTARNTGNTPIVATITATPNITPVGYAYVANSQTGTVTVFDVATRGVIKNINVGAAPAQVTTCYANQRVYVSNANGKTVSVIAAATNTKIADITVGTKPLGLAINAAGTRLYVANALSNTLSVIDAVNNTVIKTVTLRSGNYPNGVALSPDESRVYVVCSGAGTGFFQGTVEIVDPVTNEDEQTVHVTTVSSPASIAVAPDGNRIYLSSQDGVVVMETSSFNTLATLRTTQAALGLSLAPDGGKLYVTGNGNINSVVYIIDTGSYSMSSVLIGPSLEGLCVTPDGSEIYVSNYGQGEVTVINANNNTIKAHMPANGVGVGSFGQFFLSTSPCPGKKMSFKITVNPPPVISNGPVSGTIVACQGTPSANPSLQQFTAIGSNLQGDMQVDAPENFEVSLNADAGYARRVTIPPVNAVVNRMVYVRAAPNAAVGYNVGKVVISSTGNSRTLGVEGTVNPRPAVNPVLSSTVKAGETVTAINFTGNADTYQWTNNDPSIGLPASGTGNLPAFVAINNGATAVTATITVTPLINGSTCPGTPMVFNIKVRSSQEPAIYITGALTAVNTVYGTASAARSFIVKGNYLTSGISVTAPQGFELSTDNINFSPILTLSSTATTTVYIRLAKTTPAGSYGNTVTLTSIGADDATLLMPQSIVSPAPLTITARNTGKTYGDILAGGQGSALFDPVGLKNNDVINSVTINYGTGGAAGTQVGIYTSAISVTDPVGTNFLASNYQINYIPATLAINKALLKISVQDVTRFEKADNPPFKIIYRTFVNNEGPTQLISLPIVSTIAGKSSAPGSYPIHISGATATNYEITYADGTLNILALPPQVIVPNAFTPNGDNVNDRWNIPSLSAYPTCQVNIYTRTGSEVFRSTGYGRAWDGTYSGALLPAGTYYYVIDLKNGSGKLSGAVSILR